MNDPILFIGVDIGIRRDSSAVSVVYKEHGIYKEWGHKISTPTKKRDVNVHKDISNALLWICREQRVAGIWYDPYQFISESQRMTESGFGRYLFEVNQQTEMPAFSNILETCITEGTLWLIRDQETKNHFLWCTARETERGWRMVKRKQTKPIDYVVALGMALYGASTSDGELYHPSYDERKHSLPMEMLP